MSDTLLQGRHSMDSAEWYTPAPIVELARELMGGIDLDPCTCEEANETVKAPRYFTAEEDGLTREWYGRVFVNPPGGLVGPFWRQLVCEHGLGDTTEAIWVGYSLEQLQTLQSKTSVHPLDFPICIPRRRIAFVESEAKLAQRNGQKSSPSHGNYISYLGPQVERFREIFGRIGIVR